MFQTLYTRSPLERLIQILMPAMSYKVQYQDYRRKMKKVHPQHINMAEYYDYYYTGQVVGVLVRTGQSE